MCRHSCWRMAPRCDSARSIWPRASPSIARPMAGSTTSHVVDCHTSGTTFLQPTAHRAGCAVTASGETSIPLCVILEQFVATFSLPLHGLARGLYITNAITSTVSSPTTAPLISNGSLLRKTAKGRDCCGYSGTSDVIPNKWAEKNCSLFSTITNLPQRGKGCVMCKV